MLTYDKVQEWLEGIEPAALLTDMQANEVRALIGSPGMAGLIGLMLGARSACYVQLSNRRLADAAAIADASVLQGRISGIELLRETLLELFTPADADPAVGEGARTNS